MIPGGGKANVLVVPSCHTCLNNNDGRQSHHIVFNRPNLLVLRLLSSISSSVLAAKRQLARLVPGKN